MADCPPEQPRDRRRTDAEIVKRAVSQEVDQHLAQPLGSGLYLVATPIGNLGDMSLRAIAVLARADRVYCEDTRVSQTLFARFGISRKLRSYHEHSPEAVRVEILEALNSGSSVALISDAGTPAISDPGFKLVRDASAAGNAVVAIPGPSAAIAAAVVSGLPVDRFVFLGFLPQKAAARRKSLEESSALPFTLIFYESPHRLEAALDDMAGTLGDRPAAVARELTKRYEEVVRGTLPELSNWSKGATVRGEIAIVVGPPPAGTTEPDDEVIAEHYARALETASPSRAARQVADALGVPKARVYALGLKTKRGAP
ncbi:MAG: 16S rRNA (cytidine(1402)-2'-O)-methyltransferase [Hyphomicrobiaceae bacterium]|nr:16S rRNA (cytidine(1402)-2'-O)-methyltransferase [Hyphomicrobiaceae bacterium]